MRLGTAIRVVVFGALSLGAHALIAGRIERIRLPPPPPKVTPIRLVQPAPPPSASPPPSAAPPAPEPAAPKAAPRAPSAAQPKVPRPASPERSAPAPTASAGFADLGVELAGSGPGGLAVPAGGGEAQAPAPQVATVKRARPKPPAPSTSPGDCAEATVRARPLETPLPSYPEAARAAGVEGRTRVELSIDPTGQVVEARVLESPGYGLDAAALEAVRRWRFSPATACGAPVSSRFNARVTFTP